MGLCAALLCLLPFTVRTLSCPDSSWTLRQDGQKCVKQVPTGEATQRACVDACAAVGASLPCISSAAENTWLWNLIGDWMFVGRYQNPFAVSATDGWDEWVADDCASSYFNWAAGDPDDYCVREDCAFLGYATDPTKWHTVACGDTAPWSDITNNWYAIQCVCEWPAQVRASYSGFVNALHMHGTYSACAGVVYPTSTSTLIGKTIVGTTAPTTSSDVTQNVSPWNRTTTTSFCRDSVAFLDARGSPCTEWNGYDCREYPGYSTDELAAVRSACPAACNLCVTQPLGTDSGKPAAANVPAVASAARALRIHVCVLIIVNCLSAATASALLF